jgi:signal transduction histidine kinase
MNMSLLSMSGVLLGITCLILSVILLIYGRLKIHKILCFFNFLVSGWGIGMSFIGSGNISMERAAAFWKFSNIMGVFIPISFFYAILELCSVPNKKRKVFLAFLFGLIFSIAELMGLSGYRLEFMFNSIYYIRANSTSYYISTIMWFFFMLYGFFLLVKTYLNSSGIKKIQLKYFIAGMLIGFPGGASHFLPVYGFEIYPLNISIVFYAVVISYAILKYRLLDVTIVLTRTGIFIAVYTLVLGLPFIFGLWSQDKLLTVIGVRWWIIPLIIMAVLSTAGPFIYIFLQRRAEERLLKEQRRYQNVLKHAAIGMTRIRNLKKLLSLITHIVKKTVRISFVAIYLLDRQNNKYSLQVSRGPNKAFVDTLSTDSTLVKWLVKKQEPLIYEEIKRQTHDASDNTFKVLEANMRLLAASVIVPSFLDQKLSGFVVLGDKLSGQIYTSDDLSVFQVLASQAALAIENAQFYEEAKEMQAQIAQAEKMATVGTMADGLSHQINNRFYALSLIAGDSIDTLKMTDTTSCSPEIQEMIKQIKAALERIQANVMQGGEVVKGILKYTRKGDEGLEALTMDQILDATIDMVQFKIKLPEIDIIRDYPQDNPRLKANHVQMQEVFFNFIDNAYDAIVERRNTFKEEGYRGKITITAQPKDRVMQIFIKDNGIGVKNEDMKKVFTPFFTTKASSRKGTGLGLYVIMSIITENHKGKISFQSEYKVGTTFIIEIPLAG